MTAERRAKQLNNVPRGTREPEPVVRKRAANRGNVTLHVLARAVGNYIKAQRREYEKKKASFADSFVTSDDETENNDIDGDHQLEDSIGSSTHGLDEAHPKFDQVRRLDRQGLPDDAFRSSVFRGEQGAMVPRNSRSSHRTPC